MRTKLVLAFLASLLVAAGCGTTSTSGMQVPCTRTADRTINGTLRLLVAPDGAAEISRAKEPCEPSSSGHTATVTYRFAGDQASLGPHYTGLFEPHGWRAVPADETDALTLRRSLPSREALVMVVDVDEQSAVLSVWIAEVPKEPPRA